MPRPPVQIVWFKRDLRVDDHEPLTQAAAQSAVKGPVLPLYVVEPDLWQQPDSSGRQYAFITECLTDLQDQLAGLGQPLIIRIGEMIDTLNELTKHYEITALWSHQETGNRWTFNRDIAVGDWCAEHGIIWHQPRQHGIDRGRVPRNGWAKRWDRLMGQPVWQPPAALAPFTDLDPGTIPHWASLSNHPDPCPHRQMGGREPGLDILYSFLHERGEPYQKAMSSPVTAFDACSRLSPHLAYGTVSIREAAQAAWERQAEIRALPPGERGKWSGAMNSFIGRLHWHCHFIQKLESAPALEYKNLHPAYDGVREDEFNERYFDAYCRAETGFPFVDACLRALDAHGWINFRMRAMLMAFSSYHLWLHWPRPAQFLARRFTDFEAGIHYAQSQMQSSTTGINTPRIYNPVKQGHDQDPDGAFIRRWVPELAGLDDRDLHEPWRADPMTLHQAGIRLDETYPERLVDHEAAARAARERIWAVRRGCEYRDQADDIQQRHGSRKSGIKNRGNADGVTGRKTAKTRAKTTSDQASLL
ncbi:MAG: FAD-binding domain-containing protein [Pseudomonadota bacterium]